MKFNIKKFKSNISFFIICIVAITLLSLLSFFVDKKANKLEKVELSDKDININKLVINELMTSNKGTITDGEGKLYDYIELYNGSEKDIDLKNYGLSDEAQVKWVFPDVTIKSKEYLLVYLSGNTRSGLYANFKLKSDGGETLGLFKPNGKVIDAVETVALESNTVMARNEEGTWVISSPTPGHSNNISGHDEFIKVLTISDEDKKLVINEVLANNKGNFKNKSGVYSGYIEVKNISDETVDLSEYGLSNSDNAIFKWQFPSKKLGKGEVIVVYTSGVSNKEDELSTSFKLNSKNGSAILTYKNHIADIVKYENLANGIALIREGNKLLENNSISPGYQNTVDGIKDFQKKYLTNPKDLIISEAMNKNYSYLAQNGGEYYDWIELYNNGKDTIKLSDYCVTTNDNTMCMYKLPDVELKSGEYYILMASGDPKLSGNYKHTNFKLSDNESIYVTKGNKIIDAMYMANLPTGYSMGRGKEYGIYYFGNPTPGKANGNGKEAVSYMPFASIKSGTYNNQDKALSVELSGGNSIYYTLDGSTPSTRSNKYSSPLEIGETTVLRIINDEDGKLPSEVTMYSYIINENHKIAVMSLAIDSSDLKNVNTHTSLNSSVIEPCMVELIEKDGKSGFLVNGGLKLFGGSTRSYKKKSYEIKFKKEYGDAHLKYKVFDNRDSAIYDSLVLRTGSQDEFQYSKRTMIRDIVATSLMDEYTKVDVQAYKPVALYINGDYWGLYFLREKVDEHFISNHYNVKVTEDDVNLLRIDGEVKIGSNYTYRNMINFMNKNSLSNSSNYDQVKDQIDIENLCDFWVAEIWANNYDILNTRYFSSPLIDNGKWKFVYYDLDSGFYNYKYGQYGFTYYTRSQGIGFGNFSTDLLRNLMKSSEFREKFLERLSYNLKNTWSTDNFNKKIDSVIAKITEDEIERNLDRWNNISLSKWRENVDQMRDFAEKRNDTIVKEAKSYFNLSNDEVNKYFGD